MVPLTVSGLLLAEEKKCLVYLVLSSAAWKKLPTTQNCVPLADLLCLL